MTTSVQATPHAGSQLTAKNLSIEAGDISFTYRRFGDPQTDALPLVMLQHFRGNLDSWDPLLVDALARDREVVLVDNRGVGGSTGAVPENVTDMARDAIAFIDALGLERIDLLGFSLGGHVAQELVLLRPRRVRRLVLAGTAPQGGPDLHRWSDEVYSLATPDEPTADDLLGLFFSPSKESRSKGLESIQRLYSREADRDEPTDLATRDAQLAAITAWGIPDASKLNRLAGITQPTFVANGDNDTMMHTRNSQLLADHLPNGELRIYPDAGHGFLDQYAEQFGDDVRAFLDERGRRASDRPGHAKPFFDGETTGRAEPSPQSYLDRLPPIRKRSGAGKSWDPSIAYGTECEESTSVERSPMNGASMPRRGPITALAAAAAVPFAALAVAGCGGGSGSGSGGGATAATPPTTTSGQSATVGVVTNAGLGKVLVDSGGRTLYLFQADKGTKSACSGACAAAWPPLRATGKPVAGSGLVASKLKTSPRSDGKPQVVYNGHPLYRFASDQSAGDAAGQGVNAFGALWYAVSPAGAAITTATSSSGGGGSGY